MHVELQQEITPLEKDDFFILLDHPDAKFDYAPHWHTDFELNIVMDSCGERVVGDSHEDFDALDVVLIGPRLPHIWKGEVEKGNHVVTIQFPEQMLDYPTMSKRIFSSIRSLLERAGRGISYVGEARLEARDRVLRLTRSRGFDTALQFLSLLDYLATTPGFRLLASANYQPMHYANETRSRRILLVCDYVMRNYAEPIKLSDAARLTNMSESAFCHFFKKMTGKNFVDYVNDVRIGNATRRLYETTDSISEICYSCGFNNTSNFIRVFKKKRGETPSEYRSGTRKIMKKY